MKEIFATAKYYLLALIVLPLEGIFYLLLWIFIGVPLRLWEKWSYTAQCLRYPPPPGGMYGNMARAYKNRPDKSNKQECLTAERGAMTEDFHENCERDDDICMVEPQEALWEESFRSSEGVCLIVDPMWKAAPRMKLYKLDGIDRRGNRTEILVAENRNGNPGFAKNELDQTLASPYLLLSSRPRIMQSGRVILRCDSMASAVESYLPHGFLPIVTRRQQKLRQVLERLKNRRDRLCDRVVGGEILRMEFVIVPDWLLWRVEDTSEGMFFPLMAKLLRIGYGTRYLPGGAAIVANISDDPDFFAKVADFARFAGAPVLLLKRKDCSGVEKLDLTSGKSHVVQGDSFLHYITQCVNHRDGRVLLRAKSRYDRRLAAAGTLGLELFCWKNIFGKMGTDHNAKKFDARYTEYRARKDKINPHSGEES